MILKEQWEFIQIYQIIKIILIVQQATNVHVGID